MAQQVITFKKLLYRTGYRVGATPNDSDTETFGTSTAPQLAVYLTDAMRKCWEMFPWPETLVKLEDYTLGAEGLIAWADVKMARWVTVWSGDPEAEPGTSPQAAQLPARLTASGWVVPKRVYTDGTVCVFYRPEPPEYTHVVHDAGGSYVTGDLVYDRAGTGHCYKALVDDPGTDLTDEEEWQVQVVLKVLAEGAARYAHADHLLERGLEEKAPLVEAKALEAMEDGWVQVMTAGYHHHQLYNG